MFFSPIGYLGGEKKELSILRRAQHSGSPFCDNVTHPAAFFKLISLGNGGFFRRKSFCGVI
jgi:hypothetical protein